MTRKFGVEIETFGPSIDAVVRGIRNAGISCQNDAYHHRTTSYWKIVTDNSVSDGFEVVSPILSGEDGFRQIRDVCKVLNELEAKVDRRCGFHVHVDASSLRPMDVANLVTRYAKYERAIDQFMPPSRRGSTNGYCRSLVEWVASHRSQFNDHNSLDRFITMMPERGYKINLSAYQRHGTMEFRQHSGTTNANKIINWVQFCLNFVEQSVIQARSTLVSRPVQPVVESTRRDSTNETWNTIISMLRVGASAAEMAERTGYTQSTVIATISRIRSEMGYTIKKMGSGLYRITAMPPANFGQAVQQETDETYTYMDVDGGVPSITRRRVRNVVESVEDHVFKGLDASVVSFYRERADELAGN